MLQYSNEQLATIIGVPIVSILLIWTVAIFHKNRKKWSSYDIAVVAILIQSILRNLAIVGYTALIIAKQSFIPGDYCKAVVWIFNSIHTFQASSLTTLAVIALFTVKLYRKQQSVQQYLTATHVIYHLFCLTTLCACVGVASILAQEDNVKPKNINFNFSANADSNAAVCKFMPFELDVKFNIFIIVLHIFLAMVSLTAFIFICFNHFKMRRHGFDYLKKSTSDLSELSLSLTATVNENAAKNYYDTYTIQRLPQLDNNFENSYETQVQNSNHCGYTNNRVPIWNSDLSNISMTVSSTNSKRPCLKKPLQDEEDNGTGLYTMYPILTVCYLFNHLPLILICIFPRLIAPWPVSGVALWMGQLQDILIPIGLGLVDSRFCKWVSTVYKCAERRRDTDKIPPGVGLDGKFRHFGSQPQSLEITQSLPERTRTYSSEPKFPITNGSLYTSIDGRLPIIHNYRRPKDKTGCIKTVAPNSLTVNLHSSHLKRQEYVRPRYVLPLTQSMMNPEISNSHPTCDRCDNVDPMSVPYKNGFSNFVIQPNVRRDVSFGNQRDLHSRRQLHKRISLSEDSLYRLSILENMSPVLTKSAINRPRLVKNKRNKHSLNGRMSKSQDCLNDLQMDLHKFKQNPEAFEKSENRRMNSSDLACISSDDEYFTDSVNLNDVSADYDATSQSSYSITTEANCDFEFYQSNSVGTPHSSNSKSEDHLNFTIADDYNTYGIINEENRNVELTTFKQNTKKVSNNFMDEIVARSNLKNLKPHANDVSQLKITRSNSKRSLENFQAYLDEENRANDLHKIQRSNSFMTVEDCRRFDVDGNGRYAPARKFEPSHVQPSFSNASLRYLQDVYNHNECVENENKAKSAHYSCSMPDFKKIFISEYI